MKYFKNYIGTYYNLDIVNSLASAENGCVTSMTPQGTSFIIAIMSTEENAKAFLDKLMWAYLFSSKTLITYEYVMSLPDDIMDKETK